MKIYVIWKPDFSFKNFTYDSIKSSSAAVKTYLNELHPDGKYTIFVGTRPDSYQFYVTDHKAFYGQVYLMEEKDI